MYMYLSGKGGTVMVRTYVVSAILTLQLCKDFYHVLPSRIHDRKISVLGFCSLLQSPVRPAPVQSLAPKIVPAIVYQMEELVDAYKRT